MNIFGNKNVSVSNISGSTIVIGGKGYTVDGEFVEFSDSKNIQIIVQGNVNSLQAKIGDVTVNGSVQDLDSSNGNVTVTGNVNGDVTTSNGDVTCGNVAGKVKTSNGDINYRR